MDQRAILQALAGNPALLAMLSAGLTASQKAAGTSPTVYPSTGPGGLLATPGLEPDLYPAMVLPLTGLEARLPVRPSNLMSPLYGILTGQTAPTGSEPTEACAGGRVAGNLKICQQVWEFGRLTMQSKVIDVEQAGQLVNRAEFLDQRLVGNPFANVPMPAQVSAEAAFKNVWAKAHLELAVDLYRDYKPLIYTGNPANTAGSAGYIEFNGLDRVIRTGYQDVTTGQACPAADSYIRSMANAVIQSNGATYVRAIIEAYRVRLKYLAEQIGLDVKWAFVMRFGCFRALTEIWPCVYETYRCTTAAPNSDARVVIDGREQERMRADMRARRYLLIDDEEVEVIIDDAIAETIPAAGTGASDIYVVPLMVNGQASLWTEYFNYSGPNAAAEIIRAAGLQPYYNVSPDGRFLYHYLPPTYTCNQISVVTRKRLILRAPFLAAKFTSVRYTFVVHERGYDPDDPYYFVDGGIYETDQPPYFYPPVAA